MWTPLQSSCWKRKTLLSLYSLCIVAILKLSSDSWGIQITVHCISSNVMLICHRVNYFFRVWGDKRSSIMIFVWEYCYIVCKLNYVRKGLRIQQAWRASVHSSSYGCQCDTGLKLELIMLFCCILLASATFSSWLCYWKPTGGIFNICTQQYTASHPETLKHSFLHRLQSRA